MKQTFYELLKSEGCTTPETAMHYRDAMNRLALTSRRNLYEIVARERKTVVILPDNHGGYYAPDTNTTEGRKELAQFYRRTRRMGISTLAAAKTARRALNSVKGQSEMNL